MKSRLEFARALDLTQKCFAGVSRILALVINSLLKMLIRADSLRSMNVVFDSYFKNRSNP